jgi:hypothetical protein
MVRPDPAFFTPEFDLEAPFDLEMGVYLGWSPGCLLYDVESSVCVADWNTLYNVDWV